MSAFRKARRLVVKIGTSTIASDSGRLVTERIEGVVGQLAALADRGLEVIVVSSGAIAAGIEQLALSERPRQIPKLQAAAAVGQGLLVHKYAALFRKYGHQIGQVLLTQHDTTHRQQYLNARNTLNELLAMGVIPIVNENDTTAVDEIKFGDNDTLAALVAILISADLLIILSDIEGLYSADPRRVPGATLVSHVDRITPEIEAMAAGIGNPLSSGGMVTKIAAARIATAARIGMFIAPGDQPDVLSRLLAGERIGTFFAPGKKKISSRKLWIGFGRLAQGTIFVDDGAIKALVEQGSSLLPAGVVRLEGDFSPGDAVDISGLNGHVFARGLSNYSAAELDRIRGQKSSRIKVVEQGDAAEEVVHRDCLVVF